MLACLVAVIEVLHNMVYILGKGEVMNIVHLTDCMEFMKDIPDKFYELAIVDPPYGIDAGKMNLGVSNSSRIVSSNWDNAIPDDKYFEELKRVSHNQIIWGANYFNIFPSKSFIVWDKMEGMYGRSFAECELAYTSFQINAKVYRLAPNNISDKKIHKCQKPVALYKWILKNYAKTSDKIFDSHVGSGSSRIACYDMGFDFTGCELDKDYYLAQEARYDTHIMQGDLFSGSDLQEAMLKGNI